jgi:hypothetical protein
LDTHTHYEELCALVPTGQVLPDELEDFRSHLKDCPTCRRLTSDFTHLSAEALWPLAAKRTDFQVPRGMTQRFIARARSEGININRAASPNGMPRDRVSSFRPASICAAAAVVLIAASLLIIKPKFSGLRAERGHIASPQMPTTSAMQHESAQAQDTHFQEQLAAARAELNSMATTIKAQHAELESADQNLSSLDSRLVEAEQQNAGFQSERTEREARIKQLEIELEKSRSEKNAEDVALTLQEAELLELRKQVTDEAEALQEQQALAARGSDVRDLVVARNLHIVDVHDSGGGKNQKAFGRIFYTEGKSLIYYAYDLADPRKVDAKVSFYVWGQRLGSEKPIRSLGILHSDDVSDGRWVLTFDDPKVLAQIDSVFVTAESSKKLVREPQGERRLFTFLGDKPNHP